MKCTPAGHFFFGSIEKESFRRLARVTLQSIRGPSELLIGGLGMGFPLEEALASPTVESVDMVEIEPSLVEWNRTLFKPLNSDVLGDRRVRVIVDDIVNHICQTSQHYSADILAVILDVDNGPGNVIHADNTRLYTVGSLELIYNPAVSWRCACNLFCRAGGLVL